MDLKARLAARKRHEDEMSLQRAKDREDYDKRFPVFCGRRWDAEELDEVKEALEGANVNPGDEITTKRFKSYKADINGNLFRVPDDSLTILEEVPDA